MRTLNTRADQPEVERATGTPAGGGPGYQTRPFLKIRKGYTDVLAASRRKDIIHGLLEIDVTHAHELLRQRKADGTPCRSRPSSSMRLPGPSTRTASCTPTPPPPVDLVRRRRREHPDRGPGRRPRHRAIPRHPIGQPQGRRRTIHEIRTAQRHDPAAERRYRGTLAFLSLPRSSAPWSGALSSPSPVVQAPRRHHRDQLGGNVRPGGGWGIPVGPATLMITVGGIATKPRYVDELLPRELLDLTISVDHQIVDGAQAARFARRLSELVEQGDGLSADGQ